MPKKAKPEGDLLQGTLDMLILRTLLAGPAHGHSIAHAIEFASDEILQVEHGSLYPALYRLEDRGWIAAFWGTSENNRKAKYYRLTPPGKRQLTAERTRWERLVKGITRVLRPAAG
ncbi:MAG TPA: PadR family transcriptional regulator [Bryobacteraceae bacterium]|jgi:transcriptional regulator